MKCSDRFGSPVLLIFIKMVAVTVAVVANKDLDLICIFVYLHFTIDKIRCSSSDRHHQHYPRMVSYPDPIPFICSI